jgi:hypothetical protein
MAEGEECGERSGKRAAGPMVFAFEFLAFDSVELTVVIKVRCDIVEMSSSNDNNLKVPFLSGISPSSILFCLRS